ncbi:MAG: tetratricopeptide repeat protein [Desulfobacterales bacterium]
MEQRIKCATLIGLLLVAAACAGLPVFTGADQAFDRGVTLFNRGRYEEAIVRFERVVDLEPDHGEAYLYLGRSYLNLGRWQEAVAPLRSAFRLAPERSRKDVLNLLIDGLIGGAAAEMNRGDFKGAVSCLREALDLKPDAVLVKDKLGEALLAYGDKLLSEKRVAEAAILFEEAVSLLPKSIEPYIGMARALMRQGEYLEALQYVKEAETIDPDNEMVRSMLYNMLKK